MLNESPELIELRMRTRSLAMQDAIWGLLFGLVAGLLIGSALAHITASTSAFRFTRFTPIVLPVILAVLLSRTNFNSVVGLKPAKNTPFAELVRDYTPRPTAIR